MQERPVIVKESGGSSVAMFGILAIVVIVAIALFVWQPWNTTNGHTSVIVQPGAAGGGGSSAGSGSGSSGSGSSGGSSSGSGANGGH